MSTSIQPNEAAPANYRFPNAEEVSFDEIIVRKLNQLISLQTKHHEAVLALVDASRQPSSWIGPDEAAEILGFNITRSGSHRVRISWLCRQGFITKFQATRPRRYDRADVQACAEKLRNGKIHIPSTF